MPLEIADTTWVYAIVEDPEKSETILGQEDAESKVAFIPFFLEREAGQQCYPDLVRNRGQKYEIQAICFGELAKDAAKNGFMIFMLSGGGEILKKISP